MVKIVFFAVFVIFVMLYPVFLQGKPKKYKNSNIVLPKVEFTDGNFKQYDGNISKKGKFSILKMYDQKYVVNDLFLNNLIKKEKYIVKKALFKDKLIIGYDIKYHNDEFDLFTKKATYDKVIKILEGDDFTLVSKDYKGRGRNFQIDNKKDIYAQYIKFDLKVKE
jgi:hypothetical protein